jgi:hypothetical protein
LQRRLHLIGGALITGSLVEQVLAASFKAATALLFGVDGEFAGALAVDASAAVNCAIFHGNTLAGPLLQRRTS